MTVPCLVHRKTLSGIMIAALTTQTVAFTTNCLLALAPVPVLIDPITLAPVYLVRWCEWTALSGLMTFLSESIDLEKRPGRLTWPVVTALSQSLSCLCGIVFPYCPDLLSWIIVMIISCVTYFVMFPRCWSKAQNLRRRQRGSTFLSMETYDRTEFAYQLIMVCTVVWTVLVVAYFLNMIVYRCFSTDHWLRHPGLAMMVDTFFDVLAKAFYMRLIVDVHSAVFDREARAQRQLSELRRLMSVLWDSSSDVICISVSQDDKIISMLSPSFTALVGCELPADLQNRKSVAVLLETKLYNPQEARTDVVSAYYVDRYVGVEVFMVAQTQSGSYFSISLFTTLFSSEIPYGGSLRQAILARLPSSSPEVQRALEIMSVACSQRAAILNGAPSNGRLMVHPIQRVTGEEVRCEIKVSEHAEQAVIAVIRDVTERYKRFEAEQRAYSETAQRQRDAQAVNRFTRHEVKNGLLAGIELCDSLRNALACSNKQDSLEGKEDAETKARTEASSHIIKEMDSMLHEVLDTVLAEAMARDVIHESYKPRLERVDVKDLLMSCSYGLGSNERFPLQLSDALPPLLLDPQLLRYIHRNAFSNACKYGKQGGKVYTIVEFDETKRLFKMKVTNEPGSGHAESKSRSIVLADSRRW